MCKIFFLEFSFHLFIFILIFAGPFLVFLASTINGYEGTGRSLSLKLLQQLREQSSGSKKDEKGQHLSGFKGNLLFICKETFNIRSYFYGIFFFNFS